MAVLTGMKHGDKLVVKHEYPVAVYFWAVGRLMLGWLFLWSFLDRAFGFEFPTSPAEAWVNGGSPTSKWLTTETSGPLVGFFHDLAGHAWVDWVFMIGVLAIGLSLLSGVGIRIGAAMGGVVLLLIFLAGMPPEDNPLLDVHLISAVLLGGLASSEAGETWGFGRWWKRTRLVERFPFLY